ncbi:MAG: hypothetical protein GY925_16870 [Actinomycetia bacterium]|nr:hypothetical protein [Actinomycetes bacterium]
MDTSTMIPIDPPTAEELDLAIGGIISPSTTVFVSERWRSPCRIPLPSGSATVVPGLTIRVDSQLDALLIDSPELRKVLMNRV